MSDLSDMEADRQSEWDDTWRTAQRVVTRNAPDLLEMVGLVGEPPRWSAYQLGQAHTDAGMTPQPKWGDKTWID